MSEKLRKYIAIGIDIGYKNFSVIIQWRYKNGTVKSIAAGNYVLKGNISDKLDQITDIFDRHINLSKSSKLLPFVKLVAVEKQLSYASGTIKRIDQHCISLFMVTSKLLQLTINIVSVASISKYVNGPLGASVEKRKLWARDKLIESLNKYKGGEIEKTITELAINDTEFGKNVGDALLILECTINK